MKDITPQYPTIPYLESVVVENDGLGVRVGGVGGLGGKLATEVNNAAKTVEASFDNSNNFIGDIINARLDTQGKYILSDFTFGVSGAIRMNEDDDNGLWISPTGILGKKLGATTFAIDTEGNATFSGTLTAASGTLGTITAGTLSGVSISISTEAAIYFSVGSSGVSTIRFENGASNFVSNYQTAVILGGSPESYISFDTATTDITRLNIQRNKTTGTLENNLVVINDASTTVLTNPTNTLHIGSNSTGAGIYINKTGDGKGLNIAQSGDEIGLQITQTGASAGFRLDFDYTSSEVGAMVLDNAGSGFGLMIFQTNSGNNRPGLYINNSGNAGDIRMTNRGSNPTAGEIGDLAVVNGKLVICTNYDPLTWTIVGTQS